MSNTFLHLQLHTSFQTFCVCVCVCFTLLVLRISHLLSWSKDVRLISRHLKFLFFYNHLPTNRFAKFISQHIKACLEISSTILTDSSHSIHGHLAKYIFFFMTCSHYKHHTLTRAYKCSSVTRKTRLLKNLESQLFNIKKAWNENLYISHDSAHLL